MIPSTEKDPKYLRSNSILYCFIFVFFVIYSPDNQAQEVQTRPSVGLVLSGGGAHGIAHLGIIKVMEEAGLRPDYITGVSMGSIIGGFYALGYSIDSLVKIFNTIDWELILGNKIPENKVIFLEKYLFDNSILALALTSKAVVIPSGLINGQMVENTLNYYSWPAADINDFSKLPIPFMCVATDIIKYKKVGLQSGYLPDAIRASFSVPTIFTPLKIDTSLLLDGGLIRNFAATEVKEMGADIVIGSYVGFEANKEDELQTVAGIMRQIAFFRSLEDFEEEKKLVDVLIRPNTDGLPITSFDNIDSLVQRGYKAALPFKPYFRHLADSLNQISPQKPVAYILDKLSYSFHKIEITGNKTYSDEQILGVLNIKAGEPVNKHSLNESIELLYGKSWFEKVKYRIVPVNDSLILNIVCIEKPKAMLYGSVHYDNSLLSGLVLNISLKNLLSERSSIGLNTYLGQFYKLGFNYLQFIDRNQKFGLSTSFYSDNTLIPMLELKANRGDVISRNFISGLSVNRRLGLNNMMTVSAEYQSMFLLLKYDSDAHLKNLSYNYISATYDYQVNTLNTKHFPGNGVILNLSAGTSKLISGTIKTDTSKVFLKEKGNDDFSFTRFYTIAGNYKHYFSPTNKLTIALGGDILYITDTDTISSQNNFYLLGGIESVNYRSVSMAGFHSNEIPVKKLAGFKGEIDLNPIDNLHISLTANIFAIQEAHRITGFSLLTGYGFGIGYMSIIGPLKIGIMHGDYKKEKIFRKTKGYISIGYKF